MAKSLLYAGLFLALFALSGARNLQQASAPAPAGPPADAADLLFVLQASQAQFTDANTLRLSGIPSTVAFYGAGAKAGVLMMPIFTNSTAGAPYVDASGKWLNNPVASLIGDVNNSDANEAVLMSLSNPIYDAANQAVTFTITVLEASQDALKTKGGVANELVAEHNNGAVTNLITAVQPGATMSNVALFIDENRESLHPESSTKTWWLFCGPWCWGGGGWGGGWGGWGGGWGRGWGGGWGWGK